jgi:hypothetical protein
MAFQSSVDTLADSIRTAMATRFIITADLHQNIAKWRELVRVASNK